LFEKKAVLGSRLTYWPAASLSLQFFPSERHPPLNLESFPGESGGLLGRNVFDAGNMEDGAFDILLGE
jgi:hypothetical protein